MRIRINGDWYDTDDMTDEELRDLTADTMEFGEEGVAWSDPGAGTFTVGSVRAGAMSFGNGAEVSGVYYEGAD